jgi:hypothetical protein
MDAGAGDTVVWLHVSVCTQQVTLFQYVHEIENKCSMMYMLRATERDRDWCYG